MTQASHPAMELQTNRLRVVLQTREEVERMIEAMSEYERAQVSADWLAQLRASKAANPWVHAFRIVNRDTGLVVGSCSFKGPPADGVVEIAYGIHPDQERNGYATEAAMALVEYAFGCDEVRLVRAHTLPGAVASQRVLTKCGFRFVGETVDPDDGTVYRFERARLSMQSEPKTSHVRVVDISSGERYQWGAGSEGWHLLNRADLSVIQERVPSGDRERRHFHSRARQFFYVLEGEAVLEVEGARFSLKPGQGLEVPPGVHHQFINESAAPVAFLVVSAPHSHGDRTNA